MNVSELFWEASIWEMKKGYVYEAESQCYICLVCGKRFETGIIYPYEDKLYDARKAMEAHIISDHTSMFHYLLGMNKKYTGLMDIQRDLLSYFKEGLSDKEVVEKVGGGSTSTIRNHRFKLKEREKQAKVFLALMGLLEDTKGKSEVKEEASEAFITIHKGATMVDERYDITEKDREEIIKGYFRRGENGPLSTMPVKEKRKIVVLQYIVKNFSTGRRYSEKEVNRILERIYEDYATIRRYLIEYGFMERTRDGSFYWVVE